MITNATKVPRNRDRVPRSIITLNGIPVKFMNCVIDNNVYNKVDYFRAKLPFLIKENQSRPEYLSCGATYTSKLLSEDNILVNIFFGYPKNPNNFSIKDLDKVFHGYIDDINIILSKKDGEHVVISGRNVAGKMIDTKVTQKILNRTGSQIAKMFADKYGLNKVITDTYTLLGNYENDDYSKLSKESSEWDILLYAAEQDGFVVRVFNDTLYYGPITSITSLIDSEPIRYTWGYDIEEIDFSLSPYISRKVIVEVISWDPKTKTRIVEKVEMNSDKEDEYYRRYFIPNLTKAQAKAKAKNILEDINRSSMQGTLKIDANLDIWTDRKLAIHGVGLGLSQEYYITKVTHTLDNTHGYSTEVDFSINLFN